MRAKWVPLFILGLVLGMIILSGCIGLPPTDGTNNTGTPTLTTPAPTDNPSTIPADTNVMSEGRIRGTHAPTTSSAS